MLLKDHLQATGETEAAFARRLGVAASTVHRIIEGERQASADLMQRIFVATDGAVQPNDFFDLSMDRPEAAA